MLGGGFFGSGASKTDTDARVTDNSARQQVSEQGIGINLGDISVGNDSTKSRFDGNINTEYNITTSDYGAIENALMYSAGALQLGYDAVESGFDTVENFIESTEKQNQNILEFAGGSMQNQTDLIKGIVSDNLEYSAGTNVLVGNIAEQAINDSLTFGGGAINAIVDFTSKAFDKIAGDTVALVAGLGEAQTNTIAAIDKAASDDTQANFAQLVKVAGVAFVGLAIVSIYFGSKK